MSFDLNRSYLTIPGGAPSMPEQNNEAATEATSTEGAASENSGTPLEEQQTDSKTFTEAEIEKGHS